MNITCTIEVTPQQITDQMITAIESPIGSWLGQVKRVSSEFRNDKEEIWYADQLVFTGDFQIEIRFDDPAWDDDGDHTGRTVIGPEDVKRGLEIMALNAPYQFGLLTGDNGDAITANVFLQHVLFGKEVYG